MAKKKIQKKERRKDELDPSKDEFVTRSISVLDWVVERRKQLGVLFGAIIAIWIAFIVVGDYRESKREKASSGLAQALELRFARVADSSDALEQKATSKQDEKTFSTEKERASATSEALDEVETEWDGTTVASFARFVKASVLADTGDLEKAAELLEKCLEDEKLSSMRDSILSSLAVILESLGKTDDARKKYEELQEGSEGRVSLWAQYGKARILHDSGDSSSRVEKMLREIVDELAESKEPRRTDYLFANARARLLSINPEAEVPDLPMGINPQVLQQLLKARKGTSGAVQ